MRGPRIAALSVGVLLTVLVSTPAASLDLGGYSEGDSVVLNGREAAAQEREWASSGTDPAVRLTEFRRADLCGVTTAAPTTDLNGDCATYTGAVQIPACEVGPPVQPLWRRDRATPSSEWSEWRYVTGWSCPAENMAEFTLTDFRRLPIAPSVLTVQPARPQVLVNMPTIVYTDPVTQAFTTDLLGYPIEVEATPATFTWDFGDGSDPQVTTSPGHPYPDHDVAHPYTRPGVYTITLTTAFTGRYRLAGTTTWLDVVGTATTTTTSAPITAVEAPTRLVAGDCTTHPNPDGC